MRAAFLVLLVVCVSSSARGGQLHIDSFNLLDAHTSGAPIAHGTVVAVDTKKKREPLLQLRMSRVFSAGSGASALWTTAKAGDVVTVPLDPGVEWTDERKSPIERRIVGKLEGAKPGDEVIVVGAHRAQMLPASEATLRAALVITDATARTRYAGTPRAALEADLADQHIAALALAALDAQGGPSPAGVLRMEPSQRLDRYRKLGTAARKKFLVDALAHVRASKDVEARKALIDLTVDEIHPATLGEVAQVASLLDAANESDARAMGTLHMHTTSLASSQREIDLTPLQPFVAAYYPRRPSHQSHDDDLARIAALMTPKARSALGGALLGSVHTSTHARGAVDGFLLDEAARLLVESPDVNALAALATVDPSKARSTSGQEAVLGAIARIGAAIVDVSPSSSAEVTRILDVAKARAPRATVPPVPPRNVKLANETFALSPGQSHTFANGSRLNHPRDPAVLTVDCVAGSGGGGGGGSLSHTSTTGFREWWACGYLMQITDGPKGRLDVTATPVPIAPARMGFDEAFAIGAGAVAGKGCERETSADGEADLGWMRFNAKTTTGKTCAVLMGSLSRKVVRVDVK